MDSSFPAVDRNRLISNASKQLLGLAAPATWQIVEISGDTDFGFDMLVQVAVEGGIQHAFLLQLKGTESPRFIAEGTTLAYPLKRRTLNLFANVVPEVMLVVAVVELDSHGKLIPADSNIYWQWMSTEIKEKRGHAFALDSSDGETTIHVPASQVLCPSLNVVPHLEQLRDIVQAGMTLEDILKQAQSMTQTGPVSFVSKLADLANQKPKEFTALIQSGADALGNNLPPEAHAIRALIRAGSTGLAEAALDKLGPDGFGTAPPLQATLLSLRGKVLVQRRKRVQATQLFEKAYSLDKSIEHLLPMAEMRFLEAVEDPADIEGIQTVRDMLGEAETNDALALRVRVHVSLKEFEAAKACLDKISADEQLIPKLVLFSGQHRWEEVVSLALTAAQSGNLSITELANAQLIAARAAWCGATEEVGYGHESNEVPMAGAVGTNVDLARQTWALSRDALEGLKKLGWGPNVELIAPVVCGAAGLLGRQSEALALLSEAAAHRPEFPDLQLHTELLAIKANQPEQALAANLRQMNSSSDVLNRRATLLFELRRLQECESTALAIARSAQAPNSKTPMAIAVGYAAAHKQGHLVEASELKQLLLSRPDWDEYTYFAEFARQGVLQPKSEGSVDTLRAGLIKHPNSWLLASNLYSNIVVNDDASAAEAVQLAKILRCKALLTANEAALLVAAHTTLENWHEASAEAADALRRFETDDRLLGMGAVAEEMLGRTGAAFKMLERALSVGTKRVAALHNYMGLSFRLGRIDAVRSAIDKLLGLVANVDERLELMRLSTLVYLQQDRLTDAMAGVEGLAQLVDQADEEQEGMFLNVFLATVINGGQPSDSFAAQVATRMSAFSEKWPESKTFRRMSTRDNEHGKVGIHELLDPLIGDSRAQLQEFQKRELRAKQGEFSVPFILRPGFVFHYVGNPFQLWEAAMRSRSEERQFHLDMVLQEVESKSPNPERDIPLLDLAALLVLDSLDLFDKLFSLFERIAISRATVAFTSEHANGALIGGRSAARAKSILARINSWVDRIDQPSASRAPKGSMLTSQDVWSEYSELAKRGTWLNYCDDAICRALIQADMPTASSLTTIDVLELLDRADELVAHEISAKLAALVSWNVGITVSDRFLIASLVDAWPDGKPGDVSKRADTFRDHEPFSTLARAIWHPGKSLQDLVSHMANLLQSMLQSPMTNSDSAAAVLANWFTRVRLMKQADGLGWRLLCYPVLLTIKEMPDSACKRLVSILQSAVAASVSEHEMSVALETEVIMLLGTVLGSIDKRDPSTAECLLGKLRQAMPVGASEGDSFMRGYYKEVKATSNPA